MTTRTPSSDHATLQSVNAEVERIQRHQQAGRFDEAERGLDGLLARYPDHPQLVHLKGANMIQQGDTEAGLAMLKRVVDNDPADVKAMVDYASFLARAGRLDDAIPYLQQATETAPNYALAHANLGAALVIKERYDAAIQTLKTAVDLEGTLIDVHLNLAQAYMRSGRFELAIDPLFRALAIDPQATGAHVNLAQALFRVERHEAAEHHARRALELAPGAREPATHLGNILAALGRMDEAAKVLLSAARNMPQGMPALARLTQLRKTTPESPEYALLKACEANLDTYPPQTQIGLLHALGKAHDDLGEFGSAIAYLRRGNAMSADLRPFDMAVQDARHERMRDLVTPAFVSAHRGTGLRSIAPVFICGMPRSGTTLMDQMFSRHTQVQAGGELRAIGYAFQHSPDLRKVLEREIPDSDVTGDMLTAFGERYVDILHAEGLRSEYISDKMPNNYLYAGLIGLAMPRAKILIMRRHPMDCLLSNFMQNFAENQPFSTQIETLAATYRQFDKTAHHQRDVLPDQVRFVQYEDVVADPEGQMRAVMEFVGLPFEAEMLDHTKSLRAVNTASMSQVRAPIYASSAGKWLSYGPLLQDLAAALGDTLSEADRAAAGL